MVPSPNTTSVSTPRLQIENLFDETVASFPTTIDGQDVIEGLTQVSKALPPKYFYDQQGSELFEQICHLPEYYLTRTETAILETYADSIVQLTGACELVELGSGSSTKTRILLNAYQAQNQPLSYIPIDVSGTMLEASAHKLLEEYAALNIHGLIGTYEPALKQLPTASLPTRMICFIGSTIGNLPPSDCQRFLAQVSAALKSGEFFLLGLDLHKDRSTLEAAYNDSESITAAFNLNMLSHLNWRFGGDFNLDNFAHVAFYNETQKQIEIYLESLQAQTITLKTLNLKAQFAKGERLLSEISRKFELPQITTTLNHHSLEVVQTFTDPRQWFGLILARKL